ncbi:heavy metal translocating P-type ATPase [Flaviaesturariibacter flavus]|uniref:P-type Zn(2+) transporter n=1 Tax=Flaviaesturariibacter flavus TaxID=2502780 RepID=A0A4R1B7B3_9BACT|nr:heavy metal translocating P-type ATPase [Flaviaesturariibacter flavus]TCJ12095.1 heavy metal translocating P-type ATPase [Flaviaesturariibacter flavus]
MEKIRINLDILLPEVPHERDECVARIIRQLQFRRGIDRIHVVTHGDGQKAQLCFHYDPSVTSVHKVEQLAKQAGAALTENFGHLLVETTGVRHPRHARLIEGELRGQKGVKTVSVSGTGFIELEYDKKATSDTEMLDAIERSGLRVGNVEDFRRHDRGEIAAQEYAGEHEEAHPQHHGPHDHAGHGHAHAHGGLFGKYTEVIFALACGILLALGFALSFAERLSPFVSIGCYIGAYFFGGFYTTKEAIEGIRKGRFEIDFLMLVAAAGAAILGHWAEGALLLFLFSLGHSLEHYAMERARKSIAALTELAPKTALVKTSGDVREISIGELKPGDIIVVKPNSKISADGIVVKGSSSVNQAPITGESIPVDKTAIEDPSFDLEKAGSLDEKHRVFAGTINGGENLEIRVTKVAADSTLARLVKLVNEAQTQKSPTQNFTDKLEKYYVPAVLILVVLLHFAFLVIDEPFSKSFYRAMAVLVAASPCALAISTPSAVLSGVARAARGGVLVKGGAPLEDLGALTAIAFDKTGTLTEGRPRLTGVYPLDGIPEERLLETVVAVEKLSDHPLAAAIVKGGTEKLQRDIPAASNVTAIQGRGIRAEHGGAVVHVGNKELFAERNGELSVEIRGRVEALEKQGNTTMLVQQNDKLVGIITLMDTARGGAGEALTQLSGVGIRKMILLTGDNQQVAEAIAKQIGITEARGNLLPEQKVQAIEQLRAQEGRVAMVGDGVNDAPAMARSTVGIAMGAAGSDVALETADIALMADNLANLPFAIGLSRKARSIIRQNLVISLGMVALLVPLTISGIAPIGPAVIGHEGSTLVVVFNALRLLGYRR